MDVAARVGLILCVALTATDGIAVEQPLDAVKLVLRQSTSGSEKLVFLSRDPAFLFPALGGPDDPSPSGSGGLVVELFAAPVPAGVVLTAPGGFGVPGWTAYPSTPPRLSFKNPTAPDARSPFSAITLRQGKVLKIKGRQGGPPLAAPLGSVGIRITTGSLTSCALFAGGTVEKDQVGTFIGRGAAGSALADCSAVSLGGAAPICGDDRVNQPSETCDGPDRTDCFGFGCGPPGYPTECQCCVETSGPNVLPCCDSSAFPLFLPSVVLCVNQNCSGPFPCGAGVCEGGTCCSPLGSTCVLTGGNGSVGQPCCAGLECRPSDFLCCRPDGAACATGSECCSSNCAGSTCSP